MMVDLTIDLNEGNILACIGRVTKKINGVEYCTIELHIENHSGIVGTQIRFDNVKLEDAWHYFGTILWRD